MSRTCSPRIGVAKIAAILIAGSLVLTSGRTAALGQSVNGSARAYISIPLDGWTDGPAYGFRLDLMDRDGARPGDFGLRRGGPPPVLEVRFDEETRELHVGGIAPAVIPDRVGLDDGAALWIGTGLGLAAVVAIVVAADAVCIGINAPCPKDKDDDDDEDEDPDEPTPE